MKKKAIDSIAAKNRIVRKITRTIVGRSNFLILGHKNADEDCISSMVAISLLIKKLNKSVSILLTEQVNEKYLYLLNICRYNAIRILSDCSPEGNGIDTICVVDTPKPSMLQSCPGSLKLLANEDIPVIEFDHHLASDSAYIGDEELSLVTEASSTCELIGYLALKMQSQRSVLEISEADDLFTRNFVLAILTGIVGDSKMGKFIKSRREQWFYNLFSSTFSIMLSAKTAAGSSNLSSMNEVFAEISRLSQLEEQCFNYFMEHKRHSATLDYTLLKEELTNPLPGNMDMELLVSTARSVADALAEENGRLGMVAYYDPPEVSQLIQFRIRRSHNFRDLDLRVILEKAGIENGGGHEGAIGFRLLKEQIEDIESYAGSLVTRIEELL